MAKGQIKQKQDNINKIMFENLCNLQCTEQEIANVFDCSIDTINNWCKNIYDMNFSDIYKIKSAGGKVSLRRTQFKLAETSPAMAIFLGKQYLGQKDSVEVNSNELSKLDELLGEIKNEANK